MSERLSDEELEALGAQRVPDGRPVWIDTQGKTAITTTRNGRSNARRWGWQEARAIPQAQLRVLVAEVRELRRKLAAVRAILDDEPECDVHPDGDPVTCGWKYDIRRIRGVVGRDE